MVEFVKKLEQKAGGGGGKGADESDNLEHMSRYEKFILDIDMLKNLSGFDIVKKVGGELVGDTMLIDPKEDLGYEGETVGGACHALNKTFVAAKLPYYARPYMRDGKWIQAKVQKTGTTENKKVAELIRVNRITDDFDENQYATVVANRHGKENRLIDHEEPTKGMRLRAEKWYEVNHDELLKAGLVEETENGEDENGNEE